MARKVWFQLVDAATRGEFAGTQTASVLSDGTDDIEDLRDKIHTAYDHTKPPGRNLLAHLAPNQLKIYANREVYNEKNSQPLDEDSLIGVRGASKKDALIVVVPQRQRSEASLVETSLTYADGINPTSIHFSREPILTRMVDWMTGEEGKNRFLLLNSPAASGKTSLLNLFQYKNPGLNARYVSFKRAMSPWEILRLHGLDVVHEHCDYENVIFMIDDAQFQYGDAVFWAALVKDVPLMVGPGVRFIISTTHVISTQEQSSPAVFKQLETISRENLLLSDKQSLLLLSSETPLGLSPNMQNFLQLKETIIEHCNGLIGALCKSVSFYADQFRHHVPPEVECLRAFYSKKLLDRMDGTVDPTRLSSEAGGALLKCVLGKRIHSTRQVGQSLSDLLATFAKAGILNIDAQRYYVFSSLLAKRFFTHCYFPFRADGDPSTLRELVMNAIQNMSARSLASSTSSPDDFPKETTFQYLFTLGLLHNTTVNTAICSELSRSFATSTTVEGEIDFFVDGDHMWGIELVRSGAKIGEHMSRFGPGGNYAGLQSRDYVVLDFRKGVTNVSRDPRRATASFPIDDATGQTRFGEVVVKYGIDAAVTLHLQP